MGEVKTDPRVAYVVEHLGIPRTAYEQYFVQADELMVKIRHFENLRKCLHFCFLVMLAIIASILFSLDGRMLYFWDLPLMIIIALGSIIYCYCLATIVKEKADYVALFHDLYKNFTFIKEIKSALNDLDKILRKPAIVRHKDDLEALFEAEMIIIGTMTVSLMDQVGDIAIRYTHNFVELRAAAMRLGKIARRLSYHCPTLDEVMTILR